MKQIPLKGGKFALVDDEDYPVLSRWRWCLDKTGYVQCRLGHIARVVMGNLKSNQVVDHISRDKLDNRKSNLRICTYGENTLNRGPMSGRKYKGISELYRPDGIIRWNASLTYRGMLYKIGQYDSEIAAVTAYNSAALKYHGQFAYLNTIPTTNPTPSTRVV